jgi:hypothetical protein
MFLRELRRGPVELSRGRTVKIPATCGLGKTLIVRGCMERRNKDVMVIVAPEPSKLAEVLQTWPIELTIEPIIRFPHDSCLAYEWLNRHESPFFMMGHT